MTRILLTALIISVASIARAQSNVSPTDKWSWSENCGWMNWYDAGDPKGAQGVVFESTHLGGFAWAENVGWINFGDGRGPYLNASGEDFGVNIDAGGLLWGYAWGENIGWINFEGGALANPANPARIVDDRLRGYAWGENIGWINLDDVNAFVGLNQSCPADLNADGLLNFFDVAAYIALYNANDPAADLAAPFGILNFFDLAAYIASYNAGCP